MFGSILNFRYFIGESSKIWIKFITAKLPQSKRAISRFLADFKLLLKVLSSTKKLYTKQKAIKIPKFQPLKSVKTSKFGKWILKSKILADEKSRFLILTAKILL